MLPNATLSFVTISPLVHGSPEMYTEMDNEVVQSTRMRAIVTSQCTICAEHHKFGILNDLDRKDRFSHAMQNRNHRYISCYGPELLFTTLISVTAVI